MPPVGELLQNLYKSDRDDACHYGFRLSDFHRERPPLTPEVAPHGQACSEMFKFGAFSWRVELHLLPDAVSVYLVLATNVVNTMTVNLAFMVSVLRTDGGDPGTHITRSSGSEQCAFTRAGPRVGWRVLVRRKAIRAFLDDNGDFAFHLTMYRGMTATFSHHLHRSLLTYKEPLETPGFKLAGLSWRLRVFPLGVKGDGATAGVYLVLDDEFVGQAPKVILQAGWTLKYGTRERTLADVMVMPGTGRGFKQFVELDSIWQLLVQSSEHVQASVSIADVRVCRPPPWAPDTMGEWVRGCLPDEADVDRFDRLLERVAKCVEDNLDYPVKEVLRAGSLATGTALAGSMDSTLVVRMRERGFAVEDIPKYKRDAFLVLNTSFKDLEWRPATQTSLFVVIRGFLIELSFTSKPPPPPAADTSDVGRRPDEVSPSAGVVDPAHRQYFQAYQSRQQVVFVLKELKVNYPRDHMFALRMVILATKRWCREQDWSDQTPPLSRLLELVCINVFQEFLADNRGDVDKLLEAVLRRLVAWDSMMVTWGKKVTVGSPPVLLDPADAYFNLADTVNDMTRYWLVRFAENSLPPAPPPPPPTVRVKRFS